MPCLACKNNVCACKDKNHWCSCGDRLETANYDEYGDVVNWYCANCYGLIAVAQDWD